MADRPHALVWLRNALRLADNPVLDAALAAGYVPVVVYVHAPDDAGRWPMGAASRAWLHHSLQALRADLRARGSDLVVRHGRQQAVLDALVDATGCDAIFLDRRVEPARRVMDLRLEQALLHRGIAMHACEATLLADPEALRTGQGEPYRVFTPFWRKLRAQWSQAVPLPAPERLPALPGALDPGAIDDLGLLPTPRWDRSFWTTWTPGEAGAHALLDAFVDDAASAYVDQRDLPDRAGTSRLSPHLHFGEISPRQVIARLRDEDWDARAQPHVEAYERQLAWREFSQHLLWHTPTLPDENFNPRFAGFRWAPSQDAVLDAWRSGRTGIPIVDAGMRELWATGWMHNRVRLIVGSFYCKNLRQHWRDGSLWFWDTLVDADLANNAQNWQWVAGTGADAAPYFRIFNPVAQAQRFDPEGRYIRAWVPELAGMPTRALFAPWEHADLRARLAPDYPAAPLVDLKASREAALAAYHGR